MDPPTPPTVTKERLLDTLIDMADFLDGICRLRLRPPVANANATPDVQPALCPQVPNTIPEPLPERVSPSSDLDDESAALDIPEEEPIELASLTSSPAATALATTLNGKNDNPFQFMTPVLQQPLGRRAPLAQLEPELCDREAQTDRASMASKSVQTSINNLAGSLPGLDRHDATPNGDVEGGRVGGAGDGAGTIVGQPSLMQLWKGLLFASLSALFFSVCSAIVKNLKYMHVAQLAAVRFTGILLLSFPVAVTRPEPLFGSRDTRLMLVCRGVAGSTSLVLRFFAFQCMPLGEASTIVFSVPIFVTLLARIFLKEVCSFFHMVTCFLTVVGIALISKLPMLVGGGPAESEQVMGKNNERLYGVIAALSSCVFAASVIILLRKLKETDPYVIMFNFGWIALVLTTAATFAFQGRFIAPRDSIDAGLLVVLAVLSFFGQLMLTFSLRTEEAGPVSVMRATVDIVLVFIWQVAFFHEVPEMVTIAGVVLVVSCVILTGFRKWVLSLPEKSNTRRKLACCL